MYLSKVYKSINVEKKYDCYANVIPIKESRKRLGKLTWMRVNNNHIALSSSRFF